MRSTMEWSGRGCHDDLNADSTPPCDEEQDDVMLVETSVVVVLGTMSNPIALAFCLCLLSVKALTPIQLLHTECMLSQ